MERMQKALEEIARVLADHPEVNTGNSKVHYAYHQAAGAIAEPEPEYDTEQDEADGKLRQIIETLTSQLEEIADLATSESDYHKASELTRAVNTLEATIERLKGCSE